MTVATPSIAFDRFIRLEWIAQALKVRSGQMTVGDLESHLDSAGLGREARVKLKTKLKVLCLEPRPNFENFLSRGVLLAGPSFSMVEVLPFAWGAVITNYPFFAHVAELIGRLSSIQGDCATAEVHRRMSEKFGERHNVKVATRAVIQTLVDWAVVIRHEDEKRLTPATKFIIANPESALWLIEALVRHAGKPLSLEGINSTPLIFPFLLDFSLPYLVANSKNLDLRLGGSNQQVVALQDY
jgi:hypothetical protein